MIEIGSNSSSSFLIPINAVTKQQFKIIEDYINSDVSDKWNITISEKCVYGYTFFDDIDLRLFVHEYLKLNEKYVYWSDIITTTNDLDLDLLNRQVIQKERKHKIKHIQDKKKDIKN